MSTNSKCLWAPYESRFGRLILTASDTGLNGLFFPGRAPTLDESDFDPEQFADGVGQLDEYFAGTRQQFDLPLDLSVGTPFQRKVWRELDQILYGETTTYRQIAANIGRLDRIRAVGAAIGRNPLPIIIPCHRVVASDGHLTGYLGGLQRKQALLATEDAVPRGNGSKIEFGTRQLALL